MSKQLDDYHNRRQRFYPLNSQKWRGEYNERKDMRQPEMLKLLEEINDWYKLAIRYSTNNDLYKLLSQTIEKYRREKMKKIFPKISDKTIAKLEVWEHTIETRWTLEERLLQILFSNNDKWKD